MSNYTPEEVEAGLEPHLEDGWAELEGFLKGTEAWYSPWSDTHHEAIPPVTHIEVRGEQVPVEFVASDTGGEGHGESVWVVVKIGDQLFRKPGYYASHYGTDWDGTLEEVQVVERTVTFYE